MPLIVVVSNDEAKMDVSSKEAFAVREFCDRYGICRDTFYSEVKRGRLRALKVGKKTLVLKSDAESWAKSLPELGTVGREQVAVRSTAA
jgi:excisionase family DNA binding protein